MTYEEYTRKLRLLTLQYLDEAGFNQLDTETTVQIIVTLDHSKELGYTYGYSTDNRSTTLWKAENKK